MLISNSVLSLHLKGIENALHFIIIDLKALKKKEIDLTFNGVNIKPIWIILEVKLNLVFSDNETECTWNEFNSINHMVCIIKHLCIS